MRLVTLPALDGPLMRHSLATDAFLQHVAELRQILGTELPLWPIGNQGIPGRLAPDRRLREILRARGLDEIRPLQQSGSKNSFGSRQFVLLHLLPKDIRAFRA